MAGAASSGSVKSVASAGSVASVGTVAELRGLESYLNKHGVALNHL